jgi:ABC-type branched-subunit amino acid transport system ATPase component
MVALLGGNGSGKSTLLKTIIGLVQPTAGRILLEGVDITVASVRNRNAMGMGYLVQGGRVFPSLSVGENLGLAARSTKGRRLESKLANEVLFPALRERLKDSAGVLSGGQRQMLAIEMVMAQGRRLLLLDEPTGALSHDLAMRILRQISDFAESSSCSVLLVEQNAKEAVSVATRTLRLVGGNVEELRDE